MIFHEPERDMVKRMAATFYGCGSFERPYWYIGTEPGGEDQEDFLGKLWSWHDLGEAELVCNRKFHLGFGFDKWHGIEPRLQSTYRPLMLATLAFKGDYTSPTSADRVLRHEQATRFGCDSGDSALLALPARNRGSWPYTNSDIAGLETRASYVQRYLGPRSEKLAAEARLRAPVFAWMYGSRKNYASYWRTIAGGDFEVDASGYWFRSSGPTLFIVTDHVTYHRPNEYWIALGRSLRKRLETKRTLA